MGFKLCQLFSKNGHSCCVDLYCNGQRPPTGCRIWVGGAGVAIVTLLADDKTVSALSLQFCSLALNFVAGTAMAGRSGGIDEIFKNTLEDMV